MNSKGWRVFASSAMSARVLVKIRVTSKMAFRVILSVEHGREAVVEVVLQEFEVVQVLDATEVGRQNAKSSGGEG